MSTGKAEGCVASARGPIATSPASGSTGSSEPAAKEQAMQQTMVGKQAPDFEAAAFHQGGFKNLKLSDFRGKWVFLCFYPGDFTFV
jgi:peroxiredoxin (alkyl hydroperoxide reductase subunit C)